LILQQSSPVVEDKKDQSLLASMFLCAWNRRLSYCCGYLPWWIIFGGQGLYTQDNKAKKRYCLVVSLMATWVCCCFFKYGGFLLDNFVSLCN